MKRLQNTWNIVHKNVIMFYNVFVASVGLNNNTVLAMQDIEFGSVSSDRYPDPAEKAESKRYRSWISVRRTPSQNTSAAVEVGYG